MPKNYIKNYQEKYNKKTKEELERMDERSALQYEKLELLTDKYVNDYSQSSPKLLKHKSKIMEKSQKVHTRVKEYAESVIDSNLSDSVLCSVASAMICIAGAVMITAGGMLFAAQYSTTPDAFAFFSDAVARMSETMVKVSEGGLLGNGGLAAGCGALLTKTAARVMFKLADRNESKNEIKREAINTVLEQKDVEPEPKI